MNGELDWGFEESVRAIAVMLAVRAFDCVVAQAALAVAEASAAVGMVFGEVDTSAEAVDQEGDL